MGETTPSENEWLIMELFWDSGKPLTSLEIIENLKGIKDVSGKTIRVMINRLFQKGILAYTVDERDSRVYHYYPVKTKEECLSEKSARFVESYFGGNRAAAAVALLAPVELTKEQIKEMQVILSRSQDKSGV